MWKVQVQNKNKKKEIIEHASSACLYKKKNEPGGPKVLNNQT